MSVAGRHQIESQSATRKLGLFRKKTIAYIFGGVANFGGVARCSRAATAPTKFTKLDARTVGAAA